MGSQNCSPASFLACDQLLELFLIELGMVQ
jgi:hypothetical protein